MNPVVGRALAVLAWGTVMAGCGGAVTPSAQVVDAAPTGQSPAVASASSGPAPTIVPAAPPGQAIHVRLFVPLASDAAVGEPCDAGMLASTGPKAATIPGSLLQFQRWTDPERSGLEAIGESPVPASGTVAAPISDDPAYPVACLFTFDVATTADADVYIFSLGSIWFPLPAILRDDLESADWVAAIGVNPE